MSHGIDSIAIPVGSKTYASISTTVVLVSKSDLTGDLQVAYPNVTNMQCARRLRVENTGPGSSFTLTVEYLGGVQDTFTAWAPFQIEGAFTKIVTGTTATNITAFI